MVFKWKLNSSPFGAVDIFLNNELTVGSEHLDLTVHHNQNILVTQLGSCYTDTRYVGIYELFIG